jgi:hypothetical protein
VDLEALRQRIAEIMERLAEDGVKALSGEELVEAQDDLLECFNEAQQIGGPDGLAEARRAAEGINTCREERALRAEEEARIAEEFRQLAEEIAEPEEEAEEEPAEAAAEEPGEGTEGTEGTETAGDPPEAGSEHESGGDGGTETAAPATSEPVPVAASATASRPRQSSGRAPLAAVASQARPSMPAVPKPKPLTARFEITDTGRKPKNRREMIEAFSKAHEQWKRASVGMEVNIPVIHIEWEYPEERRLVASGGFSGKNLDALTVTEKMAAALEPIDPEARNALTAAGGICAPFPIDYTLLNVSEDIRPVMDNLPSFQAARGGVQFMPSYVLSDVNTGTDADDAIAQITRAQDAAGTPTKPCQTFDCKTVDSCEVYAITRCVQFGNWNARFYPELIDNIMLQVAAVQARFAEELLLDAIGAGSTAVDFNGSELAGATVSLLAAVGRATRRLRQANRAPNATLRVAFPLWVRDMIREDMSLRLAHEVEQFSIIDAWFDQQVALRGATPWYFLDGENDIQGLYTAQGEGAMLDWPTTVVFYVYFEGAWVALDGGTLDLGLVRDSTLNAGNNFQMFAETWEGLCNRGLPSLRINATVCANGASAGTFAPFPCAS